MEESQNLTNPQTPSETISPKREYKTRPTYKQRKALEKIVENHGNISKSMVEVGYDPDTAKNPKNLTQSKGFRQLCDEVGLTDQFILDALTDDIKGKPKNRKPELELAVKIKGMIVEKSENKNININVSMRDLLSRAEENDPRGH